MNDDSMIWHYGLMAKRWAEFLHQTPELEFLKQAIQCCGQPALDLACGVGGALILNIQAEYTDPDVWNRWLPEYRWRLPEPWPEDEHPRIAGDGSQHCGCLRTTKLNPFNQT